MCCMHVLGKRVISDMAAMGKEARPGPMGRSPGRAFQTEGRAETSAQRGRRGEEKQERLRQ